MARDDNSRNRSPAAGAASCRCPSTPAAGDDGSIRLWALPTDEPIGTPLPGATTGGWGTFFPNGKEVVAVFGSGTGVLWNVDPTSWSAQACQVANRNFTRAEWRAYLPNRPYRKTCPS